MLMTTDPIIQNPSTVSSSRFPLTGFLLVLVAAFFLTACGPSGSGGGGGGGGGGGDEPPAPDSTLSPRIFILGTEIDADNKLHVYINGVDAAGDAITLAEFLASDITVDGDLRWSNGASAGAGGITVQALASGDPISLSLLTDYSLSIELISIEQMSQIYEAVIDSLPAGYSGQVLNFSDSPVLQQDWIADKNALRDAVQFDATVPRENTAFYDGISESLYRDNPVGVGGLPPGDGLTERCTAVRLFASFTDGLDTASVYYIADPDQQNKTDQKDDLISEIDVRRIVAIMFGSGEASKDELNQFAGDRGGFIYAPEVDEFPRDLLGWIESLDNIVEIVVDAGTFDQLAGSVRIALDILDEEVLAPYEVDCLP